MTVAPRRHRGNRYQAYLSSAEADRPVGDGIQKGLHRIGRRWNQMRALRVFRADSADPDRAGEALESSDYLIVVHSPAAAESDAINRDLERWLQRRGSEHLMIV